MSIVHKLVDRTSYGRDQAALIKSLRGQIAHMHNEIGRQIDKRFELEAKLKEYEVSNLPSMDMNLLFAIVVDYHRIVKRAMLPDPIETREDVRKLHDKYHVTWPPKQ